MSNLKQDFDRCWYCESFYGDNYGEPVCSTCHYFLFPDIIDDIDDSVNRQQLEQKLESNDSGNEDSVDGYEQQQQQQQQQQFSIGFNRLSSLSPASAYEASNIENQLELSDLLACSSNNNQSVVKNNNNSKLDYGLALLKHVAFLKVGNSINTNFDLLSERILALTTYKQQQQSDTCCTSTAAATTDTFANVPIEVLIKIFRNLDDFSLWSASLVCKKWSQLILAEINDHEWKSFVSKRWILYKPAIRINSWKDVYAQLVESSNCLYCLRNIYDKIKVPNLKEFQTSWRHRRLLLELKALQQDPPDGINAKPLDSSCFYWQAAITGPHGSPYEGGIFYLFLQIPQSYPLKPPLVRFITKIFHPNISRHGDIGLDSIHDNWSLALTISKVLISIQSLLTDPYTNICMENKIGEMYNKNRTLYEKIARAHTWKYAMGEYLELNSQDSKFLKTLVESTLE